MKKVLVLLLPLTLALGLTACDQESDRERNVRGRGDGPVGTIHDNPSEIFNFPDHYSNIATQCDGHGHRLYSATRNEDAAPHFIVIDDPSCAG